MPCECTTEPTRLTSVPVLHFSLQIHVAHKKVPGTRYYAQHLHAGRAKQVNRVESGQYHLVIKNFLSVELVARSSRSPFFQELVSVGTGLAEDVSCEKLPQLAGLTGSLRFLTPADSFTPSASPVQGGRDRRGCCSRSSARSSVMSTTSFTPLS